MRNVEIKKFGGDVKWWWKAQCCLKEEKCMFKGKFEPKKHLLPYINPSHKLQAK